MSSRPVTPHSKDLKSNRHWRFDNNGTPCEWEESYQPGGYHPVHILDVFASRYRVIRKLGYGSFSTVWLAIDLLSQRYVALKVLTADTDQRTAVSGDLLVHDSLRTATNGDYSRHIVVLLDSFTHQGPNGTHLCLVYEAMGPNVNDMLHLAPECRTGKHLTDPKRLPKLWARRILRDALLGLQFLHSHGIVHGDVHPGNFLFTIKLLSPASNPPESLQQQPEDRNWLKRLDGKVDLWAPKYLLAPSSLYSYTSLDLDPLIKLADFGGGKTTPVSDVDIFRARPADVPKAFLEASPTGRPPTPAALRAPELVLGERLTTGIDIWSFGCLIFELLTGAPLFQVENLDGDRLDETENDGHLVQIIETIQPLTQTLFDKWPRASVYYGQNREGPLLYEDSDVSGKAGSCEDEGEQSGRETDEEDANSPDQGLDSESEEQVPLAYLRHIQLMSLEERFRDRRPADIDDREEEEIVSLMRLALQPDVTRRASAAHLLQQPWFSDL
ncbi:kinase-like protein [Coniochaeta sp. PMI_546]|nr:kinase-like protein [Coniochaeta sp. PMI_546]